MPPYKLENKPFLDQNEFALPCGLMPAQFPLDEFQLLFSQSDNNLYFDIEEPEYDSEINSRYAFSNIDLEKQWMDVKNSRFSQWMVG